ncbi:hypothetical protein V502_01424, partial [Pseudogymnoascus sp. VKM F-4520 (FW-2644)]
RARKTQLQQGGSLSQQQAQELQDERDVVEQVEQEIRASSGRKPREETRARRCGKCSKTGHNARTCQIAIDTSEEEYSERDASTAFHVMSLGAGSSVPAADSLSQQIVSFVLACNARLVPACPASRSAESSVELIAAMPETLLMLGQRLSISPLSGRPNSISFRPSLSQRNSDSS